nr:MAG TPA_asm: hypothetical protein [Caudoviricetes sp.]
MSVAPWLHHALPTHSPFHQIRHSVSVGTSQPTIHQLKALLR